MRLAVFVIVSSWKNEWSQVRPARRGELIVTVALGGWGGARLPVLDAAGAAPVREEADRPAQEHEEPVLEPDQIRQVDAQPQRPGREAGDVHALDIGDGLRAADR